MSLFSTESIKIYAEAAGISTVSDDVANVVAQDMEYRLREILQESLKHMTHSKRSTLLTTDINYALSSRNVENIYGYSSMTSANFRPVPFTNVFYVEDNEVDFEETLRLPFPKMPQRKTYGCHWLAVEGVQPLLPQNPSEVFEKMAEKTTQSNLSTNAEVKQLVKHALPKEQQLYFAQLSNNLMGDDVPADNMIRSMKHGVGLQWLVPYFIQLASETVARNLRNLKMLKRMIGMLRSLLGNRHVFMEPYLHQMMPIVLTCLVGKHLCNNPNEDHWALRDLCADTLHDVCTVYKNSYSTIQPRITKTLLRALLDPSKSLPTHYGAIKGLAALGHQIVKLMVIPHVKSYGEMLSPYLNGNNALHKAQADKCFHALLAAVADAISKDPEETKLMAEEYNNIYGIFGESLVPIITAKSMTDDQ